MYPYVTAYSNSAWNSPNCGSCWEIPYRGKSIFVTAIDLCGTDGRGDNGTHFDLSMDAFREIFGDDGISKGILVSEFKNANPCKCKGNRNCLI
jgi:hypothetical protein